MLDEYGVTYQPGNAIEQDLVDEMISARWRGGRLAMIVTSLLDMQMDEQRQSVQPPRRDPARPIATAFMSLADQSKALALALRYESRLRRIHERAFATADPSGAGDGGQGTDTRPETKHSEGEQAPPAAAPAARPTRCAPKKMSINEPTVRYALKIFHPYAGSKAAR